MTEINTKNIRNTVLISFIITSNYKTGNKSQIVFIKATIALNRKVAEIKTNIGNILFHGKTKATILIKSEMTEMFEAVTTIQLIGISGANKTLTMPCKIIKKPSIIIF